MVDGQRRGLNRRCGHRRQRHQLAARAAENHQLAEDLVVVRRIAHGCRTIAHHHGGIFAVGRLDHIFGKGAHFHRIADLAGARIDQKGRAIPLGRAWRAAKGIDEQPEREPTEDAAEELGDPVADRLVRGHAATDEHRERHCRSDVPDVLDGLVVPSLRSARRPARLPPHMELAAARGRATLHR